MRGHVSRPLLVHASFPHAAMGGVGARLLRSGGGRRGLICLRNDGQGGQRKTCTKGNPDNPF
jgi:hypothetical protein